MKITQSNYNPLSEILELFPSSDPKFLMVGQLWKVRVLLDQGGVHCESDEEVVTCIKLLHNIKVLCVEEWYRSIDKQRQTSYLIARNI